MLILAQTSTATAVQETVNTLIQGGAISIALVLSFIVLLMVGIAWRYAPRLFDAVMAFFDKVNAFTQTLADTIASLQRLNEQSHAALAENTTITRNVVQSNERIESAVNANNTIATQTAADITAIKKTLETLGENVQNLVLDSGTNISALSEVKQKLAELAAAVSSAVAKMEATPTAQTTVNVATVPTDSSAVKDSFDTKQE